MPSSTTPTHLLLLLLLLLLFISFCGGDSTATSQCSTLLDFKQSSFTNSSSKLDTWHPRTNCCFNWEGVTCDPLSGLVIGLDLSGYELAGNINNKSTLFNLTSLRTLNLSYNLFDPSPIPNGFEFLTNLTSLNLSTAGFKGQIPIGIAKLVNLVSLDLSTYDDEFRYPLRFLDLKNPDFETLIRNMSNLRELYLDGVDMSSSAHGYQWSAAVAKWTPKLRALSLSECSITGPFHSSFAGLHNLSVIRLDYNQLNCPVPEFLSNLSSLYELSLKSCGLNGVIPNTFVFLLRHLTVLCLSYNEMLSGLLPDFPDESKLESLDLSISNFSGMIPTSIGNLQHLTFLDLSQNQLSGQIPSSIGNLQHLTDLVLFRNQLSGQIPSSIGNLQHLTDLYLSQNHLSGQIPSSIGNLQHLTFLGLSENQLFGHIPSSIGNLQHLTTLGLFDNQLSGQIPRSIFHLSGLKILALGNINFSDTLELSQFSSFRNLTELYLSYISISIHNEDVDGSISFPNLRILLLASCNLTKVPGFLRNTNQLLFLDLSNNKIVGSVPNWIWSVGNGSLQQLNLSYNMFTYMEVPLQNLSMHQGISIDLHSNLIAGPILLPPTTISLLDYSNNNFSSSIPSNISSYLDEFCFFLSLANNSITGEIPPSVCNASNLDVLDFSNNKLSGMIPPCLLKGSNSLEVLNLRGNQLHGTIPQNISRGCGLQTLNLNGNYLEGRLPQSLANCSSLEFLDLGNNHINDAFPFWLGKIISLRVLVLRSNQLYGPVEPPLGTKAKYFFRMLQILDISSNHFNGSLPFYYIKHLKAMMVNSVVNRTSMDIGYMGGYYLNTVAFMFKGFEMELVNTLTIFIAIDFSNNNFEGIIPETIGELKSLIVLNISHNALDGNIPPSIGNLSQLESLDLSRNKLSGSIPQELCDLTFLSSLNLSNNNLVGKIPQGNQLSTFSNASFNGNERLCGVPLTKLCNNAAPAITNGKLVPLKSNHSLSTYVVGLALFIGLGFGAGFAVVILLQNISWKSCKGQISGRS